VGGSQFPPPTAHHREDVHHDHHSHRRPHRPTAARLPASRPPALHDLLWLPGYPPPPLRRRGHPDPGPDPGRLAVARRLCAECGAELPIPGLFGLGVLSATVGALDACAAGLTTPPALFARHWTGDWGEISPEDEGLNEDAIHDGARIFSVYHLQGGGRVWCITEADRHATTLLLPDEY